jgi:hypothetical protein
VSLEPREEALAQQLLATPEYLAGPDSTDIMLDEHSVDDGDVIDAPTWYIDHDADGHGSTDYTIVACTAPLGYTDDASDCDDLDPAAHPGATEVCAAVGETPVDEDCDGFTDDATAVDALSWYADIDGDTYGDPNTSCYYNEVNWERFSKS